MYIHYVHLYMHSYCHIPLRVSYKKSNEIVCVLNNNTLPDPPVGSLQIFNSWAFSSAQASRLSIWSAAFLNPSPIQASLLALAFSISADFRSPRLKSTNLVEWINKEILRRTRVATLFPNEESLLRLVSAVLVEISEEWKTGRRYLTPESD